MEQENCDEIEAMGFYDNKERIDRGWLTTETAIQLKLFNSNLTIWKSKFKGKSVSQYLLFLIVLVRIERVTSA